MLWSGRACNTRQSPLSIVGAAGIPGIYVQKDAEVFYVPFEKSRVTEFWLRVEATCSEHMQEVSRGRNVTVGNGMREFPEG